MLRILHKLAHPTPFGADLALLGVTAIWGTTFVAVKSALVGIGPLWFIGIRFSLATIVLMLIYPRRTKAAFAISGKTGCMIGFVLFAGYLLQTIGLQYTSATSSAFITGLSVVLVPIIGRFWDQKKPSVSVWLGIGCAVAGLGLLTLNESLSFNLGDIITIFSALALALHIVLVGQFAPRQDAVALSVFQIAMVAACGLVGAIFFELPPIAFGREFWNALAVTAIPATAIAIVVQNAMQRYTSPIRTAVIFAAEPVFAGLFAFLFLGEALTAQQWTGCGLIVAGMLTSELG